MVVILLLSILYYISTHVPRAGDDTGRGVSEKMTKISTHVPRAGDDVPVQSFASFRPEPFQPTSPVRETTGQYKRLNVIAVKISTHVPRAGDDGRPRGGRR